MQMLERIQKIKEKYKSIREQKTLDELKRNYISWSKDQENDNKETQERLQEKRKSRASFRSYRSAHSYVFKLTNVIYQNILVSLE